VRRLYLIRHAKAGDRHGFDGDDSLRPLSRAGREQATLLADLLAGSPHGPEQLAPAAAPARVLSSPAQRCIETVEPLAERVGVHVEVVDWLAEGSDPNHALGELTALPEEVVAACSHGDVIWGVLEWLARGGVTLASRPDAHKGSTWVLDWPDSPAEGVPVRASYLDPPVPGWPRP
jgi:8-oxo-dGTP diphosphatase